MRTFVLAGGLGLLLALTAYLASRLWLDLGDVEISLLGWLMIAGGGFFALAIGGGLMALAFYSDRKGHDDAHHRQSEFDPRRQRQDDDPDIDSDH